jgi:hypothetical protein
VAEAEPELIGDAPSYIISPEWQIWQEAGIPARR